MSHNRHNRGGRNLMNLHKKTRGRLHRTKPSRSKRFPSRRG